MPPHHQAPHHQAPHHQAPDNLRGALLMVAGMASFAVSDACMKRLGAEVPLFEAMLLRGLGVTAALGLMAWGTRARWSAASPRDRRLMLLRALAEMATAWTYLQAIILMPIANVAAIFQASPLVITLAGAALLGERVGRLRWAAISLGFAGVLVILRPGGDGWGAPSLLVLASVLCVTLRDLVARRIDAGVPSVLVAAVTALGVTLFAGLGSAFVDWRPLSGQGIAVLALTQVALLAGYVCVVGGMRRGEVSFVAPFRYASLLASLVTGWALFGTFPQPLTLLGAGIVVAGGVMVVLSGRWREEPAAA